MKIKSAEVNPNWRRPYLLDSRIKVRWANAHLVRLNGGKWRLYDHCPWRPPA